MQKLYSVVLGTSNGVPTMLLLTMRNPVGNCPDITLNCGELLFVGSGRFTIAPSCMVPNVYPDLSVQMFNMHGP